MIDSQCFLSYLCGISLAFLNGSDILVLELLVFLMCFHSPIVLGTLRSELLLKSIHFPLHSLLLYSQVYCPQIPDLCPKESFFKNGTLVKSSHSTPVTHLNLSPVYSYFPVATLLLNQAHFMLSAGGSLDSNQQALVATPLKKLPKSGNQPRPELQYF